GIGSTFDCADHSNSVCFLVRSTISWPLIVGIAVVAVMMSSKTQPRIHADEHGSESVLIRENPWPKDFKTCASALWPSARLPLSFLYRTLPHRGPGRASRRKNYPSSR